MENKVDDLGFIVVPNPKAGRKTMFQVVYPLWYKVKAFPRTLLMMARMKRRNMAKMVLTSEKI